MNVQDEGDAEQSTVTTWTMRARGLRGLPYRLLFVVAQFSRPLWWSLAAVVPAILLSIVVFYDHEFVESYALLCAGVVMIFSQSSEQFVDTTVEVDSEAGEVVATYHMSDPTVFASPQEKTIPLEKVETARFRSVAGYTMVWLHKKVAHFEGTPVLVPEGSERQFRDTLQRHDVAVRDDSDDPTGWAWSRCVVTAFFLLAVPLTAMVIWPVSYSWPTLVVLGLHSVMIPMQGW